MKMNITKISPQRKKGFFNIFVDGKFSFSLSEDDLVYEKLKEGVILNDQKLKDLKFKGKFSYYFNRILGFLSFRPRSEKEILDKLKEISYKDKETSKEDKKKLEEAVFKKIKALKLADDREFGIWFIEARRESRKPSGVFKIRRELFIKGLKKDLIEELLSNSKSQDKSLVFKAAGKKLKNFKKLPVKEFKSKMFSYLLKQGFEYDLVLSVVDTIVKGKYNKSGLDVWNT